MFSMSESIQKRHFRLVLILLILLCKCKSFLELLRVTSNVHINTSVLFNNLSFGWVVAGLLLFAQEVQFCSRSKKGWEAVKRWVVTMLGRVHSRRRRSRCRARCNPELPGTCLRPRRGTRSRGSPFRTNCRNLFRDDAETQMRAGSKPSWSVQSERCSQLTLFTVRLSVLQVEGVVSDWLLAAGAQEAVHVPRLFEGVYHLLWAQENNVFTQVLCVYVDTASGTRPCQLVYWVSFCETAVRVIHQQNSTFSPISHVSVLHSVSYSLSISHVTFQLQFFFSLAGPHDPA